MQDLLRCMQSGPGSAWIAKPIKFDLAKQAQFGMTQEDIDRLDLLQKRLKDKFGEDERRYHYMALAFHGVSPLVMYILFNMINWMSVNTA